MCGPHGTKFLKPVELRLPHSASMTPEGWSFALNSSNNSSGIITLSLFSRSCMYKGSLHFLGAVGRKVQYSPEFRYEALLK
jgi:hypothetical protein